MIHVNAPFLRPHLVLRLSGTVDGAFKSQEPVLMTIVVDYASGKTSNPLRGYYYHYYYLLINKYFMNTFPSSTGAGLMNTVINYASGKPSNPLHGYYYFMNTFRSSTGAGLTNTVINNASGKPSNPLRGILSWTYIIIGIYNLYKSLVIVVYTIRSYDSPAKPWPQCTKCCRLQL